MAWYKPGRNAEHPGDPPPKWAPLSRKARLALLVTVVAGVVIALVIIVTRPADAADAAGTSTASAPSASPWNGGQRVEVPDAGFAMTFPEDWVVELFEEGSDRPFMILAQPDRFGPEVNLQRLLVAEGPDMQERDTFTFCTLVRYTPVDVTADEFLHEVFGQSDEIVVEWLHDRLSRVLVNPWIQSRILVDTPEAIYVDHYAIGADSAVAVLMCYGMASHRDKWLSIAESFEVLPADE